VPDGPEPLAPLDPALALRVLRVGAAIGAQFTIEAASFSLVTFLVGDFGATTLGGHHVALTLVSMTFQLALGVAAAASVRVGSAIGRGDAPAARRAGLVAIAAGGACMSGGALLFVAIPGYLARVMTDDDAVVYAAAPLVFVAGCFQLSDGVQTIAQGALRGAGDTRWPLAINVCGHYAIGLPLGAWLAWERGLGAAGLWWGLSAGLTVVAVLMTIRFLVLSARPAIARV
jgi:MATE family multidrug resistance protein